MTIHAVQSRAKCWPSGLHCLQGELQSWEELLLFTGQGNKSESVCLLMDWRVDYSSKTKLEGTVRYVGLHFAPSDKKKWFLPHFG